MRIHHLNCATFRPLGGPIFRNAGDGEPPRMVTHVLAIETDKDGLVLVDTGFGLDDVGFPKQRLAGALLAAGRPLLDSRETLAHQLPELGFKLTDVRHVVMTHLDVDHTGGLPDLPNATVHVLREEYEAATRRESAADRSRYTPAHIDAITKYRLYETDGEPWFGFAAARQLEGIDAEIAIVPLPGHSKGHAGVAVYDSDQWLLHAGDSYFFRGQRTGDEKTPFGASLFQKMVQYNGAARKASEARVRELASRHAQDVRIICSHDPIEFEACRRG